MFKMIYFGSWRVQLFTHVRCHIGSNPWRFEVQFCLPKILHFWQVDLVDCGSIPRWMVSLLWKLPRATKPYIWSQNTRNVLITHSFVETDNSSVKPYSIKPRNSFKNHYSTCNQSWIPVIILSESSEYFSTMFSQKFSAFIPSLPTECKKGATIC